MLRSLDPFRTLFLFQQSDGAGEGGGGEGGDAGGGEAGGGEAGGGDSGSAGDSGGTDSGAGTGGDTGESGGTSEGSGDGGEAAGGGEQGGLGARMTPGDTSEGDAGGEGKPDTGAGAPEAYAEFTTPDDGVPIDQARLESVLPRFKEAGLTQEQAQAMVTLESEFVAQQQKNWNAQRSEWLNELQKDPTFGGDKFDGAVANVQDFLQKHTSSEDYQQLVGILGGEVGYGDYPPLFRLLHKFASLDKQEDSFSGDAERRPGEGKSGQLSEKEQLKQLYPQMPESSFG